nr:uncharacterized protein LOC113692368 [Coffea arabica]
MHLWPSMRLRDSFKIAYLKKLELNLHRMNLEKKQQQQQQHSPSGTSSSNNANDDHRQKLLDDNSVDRPTKGKKLIAICGELLLIFSCCYCCFCCGACVEDEES